MPQPVLRSYKMNLLLDGETTKAATQNSRMNFMQNRACRINVTIDRCSCCIIHTEAATNAIIDSIERIDDDAPFR